MEICQSWVFQGKNLGIHNQYPAGMKCLQYVPVTGIGKPGNTRDEPGKLAKGPTFLTYQVHR